MRMGTGRAGGRAAAGHYNPAVSNESVSIVVPTFREAKNIPVLAERLFRTLGEAGISGELLIVDDDSRDGSQDAVRELAERYPIRIIVRTDERGLSSAVIRGFTEARHGILLCMDADLSHPPESVPDVIAPIAENRAEFCIGSRYVSGGATVEEWGFLRRLNSWGATLLARPLTSVSDPMAGYFCLRRATLDRARAAGLNPVGYKIGLEILVRAGCRDVAEVPIVFSDRLHGESKLTLGQQMQYLRHLWRLYRFRWPILAPMVVMLVCAAAVIGIELAIRHWVGA